MPTFAWTVPTRRPAEAHPARAVSFYEQVARGADQAGFDALYLPWDDLGDSTLVVAGIVARATRQARVIVETHAGAGSPVYLAKLFASAQRAAGGRLDVALRSRPGAVTDASLGAPLSAEAAEGRVREFAEVFRGVWNAEPVGLDDDDVRFDADGVHFQVAGGGLRGILSGSRRPALIRPAGDAAPAEGYDEVVEDVPVPGTLLRTRVLVRSSTAEAATDAGGDLRGIVGDVDEVASALQSALDAGVEGFVFTADDPIGELYRVAEQVLPRLDAGRRAPASAREEIAS